MCLKNAQYYSNHINKHIDKTVEFHKNIVYTVYTRSYVAID